MTEWNAAEYSRQSSLQEAMADEVLRRLELEGSERVLDVGCGDGKITAQLAARVPRGSVVGVDASQKMIAFASSRFDPSGWPNLRFEVADARRLPFRDEFDLVVSFNALHWIPDQGAALRSIRLAMKPSGRALLRLVPAGERKSLEAVVEETRRSPRWAGYFGDFRDPYLNLGIEAGEIMSRDFARWPQFERLYEHVRAALGKEWPELRIGISFGLGELRVRKEVEAAKALIANSDYVGISFYPYASAFDEKFGAPPYRGAKPWREPLAWLRAYTRKPLAICETGFTTQDIDVSQYGLKMHGNPAAQAAYTKELFEIAHRDHYAFVVWFLAIDYDRLYAKLPPGSDAMKLWRNIGFFDGELNPKPAWEIWKAGVEASRGASAPQTRDIQR